MGRIDRINQQVKREISRIIQQELGDPRLQFVSILNVDVSRDLHNAKIYFSVLGDKDQTQEAETGLEGARGMVRRLLGQNLNLRYTPELFFIYDQSIEISARIEETLKEIHDECKEHRSNNQEE